MFSLLPDLTPSDSHSLWYTSSRRPTQPSAHSDSTHAPNNDIPGPNSYRRPGQLMIERSHLARLRADEQYMDRRCLNVQNYGSTWLKPPGVAKTLHQLREEKREQEEHAEALRREAVAEELAEAEAAGMERLIPGEDMDDIQLDGARDLDEDIPDADGETFEFDEDESEGSDTNDAGEEVVDREGLRGDLVAARMRMTDDAFREAVARGDADGGGVYGADDEEADEEERGHMLDEEDFMGKSAIDMGMDANLDDDIPEAESAGYEHTDTEAELSSSDGDYSNVRVAPHADPLEPPQSPTLQARARHQVPRTSMDLSSILSRDESSILASSPQMRGAGPPQQHQ